MVDFGLAAYVEPDVPDVSINPAGYRQQTNKPLHRVRLSRNFFEGLLADNGLAIHRLHVHGEHDGQAGIYLKTAHTAPVALRRAA